jgi:hypothetical protein
VQPIASDDVVDAKALYFGVELDDRALTPDDNPRLGTIGLDAWLAAR